MYLLLFFVFEKSYILISYWNIDLLKWNLYWNSPYNPHRTSWTCCTACFPALQWRETTTCWSWYTPAYSSSPWARRTHWSRWKISLITSRSSRTVWRSTAEFSSNIQQSTSEFAIILLLTEKKSKTVFFTVG